MQRFILLTCLTAFVAVSPALAQQMEDVIHLKNGGLIRGTIIEQIPNESLKIKTRDGNVFIYTMDEIAKMSKEPVVVGIRHIGIQEKNPVVSCILSLVLPGAGQFYNEEAPKGVAHLGVLIGGWALSLYNGQIVHKEGSPYLLEKRNSGLELLGLLTAFGTHVWSAVDASISASRINRQSQQPSYGHLIELGGSRATLGVDPVVSQRNLGTRLTLHF